MEARAAAEPTPDLVIENPCGGVRMRVRPVSRVEIETFREGKPIHAPNVVIEHLGDRTVVRCAPDGGGIVDLDVVIGYRLFVKATTVAGAIEYDGFGQARLQTTSGDVSLRCPWDATQFALESADEPDEFVAAVRYRQASKRKPWVISDRLPEDRVVWGAVLLVADKVGRLELQSSEGIPLNSPIKMHWQAEEMLPRLFRRFGAGPLKVRDGRSEPSEQPSGAAFSAEVRLVQLTLSAVDGEGRSVPDLSAEDFLVYEDYRLQEPTFVAATETPFNLGLLLDCSGSTESDRGAIEAAARNFVGIAREQDRVAVYALADTAFQVLAPLTTDHAAVARSVRGIEIFGGGTPLYDSIVLAYAEEFSRSPRQRNALVVLTDGVDNSFFARSRSSTAQVGAPSAIRFASLLKAAEEMHALIYPVVLDPVAAIARTNPTMIDKAVKWGSTVNQQAEALAAATGGRVFHAQSLEDLDGVYEQVARELRSVYTLSYRPTNQDFDGEWRRVRVTTSKPGTVLRTRPGYYGY